MFQDEELHFVCIFCLYLLRDATVGWAFPGISALGHTAAPVGGLRESLEGFLRVEERASREAGRASYTTPEAKSPDLL